MSLSEKLLTPQVEAVISSFLGLVGDRRGSLEIYYQMLRYNTTIAFAAEVRVLLGLSMMQEYSHSQPSIQAEVRKSISAMHGSFANRIAEMMQFIFVGLSFSEVAHDVKGKKATLKAIQTLNPKRYSFDGEDEIEKVIYRSAKGSDIEIPYLNGIHLTNQPYLAIARDPLGIPSLGRVVNFWELEKLILAALAIANQRQATPILVGKTDTRKDVVMLDENGYTLIDERTGEAIMGNQGSEMLRSLRKAENSSAMVIDLTDEIIAISQQTDGKLLLDTLHYIKVVYLESLLIPETITGIGGSGTGDSNLNSGHRWLLMLTTIANMKMIGEALIEQVIRPMLEFNHGELDDYGKFPIQEDNPMAIELLNAISNACQKGTFENQDLEVANKARSLIGVAPK